MRILWRSAFQPTPGIRSITKSDGMVAIDFPKKCFAATRQCGNKDRRSCLHRSRPSVAQFHGDRRQATEKATLPLLEGPRKPRSVCCDSTHTGYNKLGSQIRTVNPTGAINTTVYDAVNRLVASIDPLDNPTTTIYDAASQTIASVNALNQRSTTVYNAANQAVASINALGFRTTQVHDAASRSVASLNP